MSRRAGLNYARILINLALETLSDWGLAMQQPNKCDLMDISVEPSDEQLEGLMKSVIEKVRRRKREAERRHAEKLNTEVVEAN